MIALLVMTDGRKDCIVKAIKSAQENLMGPVLEFWIHDDSGDPDYHEWLRERYQGFIVVGGGERRGFGGAIENAWKNLRARSRVEFVFHLEDDFTFNRPVPLLQMMETLEDHPTISQMALRRQPWNDTERRAGGVVECHPDSYLEIVEGREKWLAHSLFFTTNPCLYRRRLMHREWPTGPSSEVRFTVRLRGDGQDFGYWGARDSGEWVTQIGDERVGTGY